MRVTFRSNSGIMWLGLLAFNIGCSDEPTAPERAWPIVGTASPDVSDAVHNGGNPHFYLLAPIVAAPRYTGVFDPSQRPVVEICMMSGGSCGPLVAAYTLTTGPGQETVRVNTNDENYIVNWKTGAFELDLNALYRIRVKVLETVLGHIDVRLVNNGSAAKNANTGDLITLVDGRTLPIKFRIEQGSVAVVGANGGVARLNDGAVAINFPDGAVGADMAVTATPLAVGVNGTDTSVLPGSLYEFLPSPTTFAQPATLTMRYGALPAGVHADRLVLCKMIDGVCQFIAGSHVDAVARTVTASISSFSEYAISEWPQFALLHEGPSRLFTAPGASIQLPAISTYAHPDAGARNRPSWSSDGARLVWSNQLYSTSLNLHHNEIRSMNWDGSGQVTLAGTPTSQLQTFGWSPVGNRILYLLKADPSDQIGQLIVMGESGAPQTVIDNEIDLTLNHYATWSPDGQQIAWTCKEESVPNGGVCIANVDGTGHRLVTEFSECYGITWINQGSKLALIGNLGGVDGIWVMNTDGANPVLAVPHRPTSPEMFRQLGWSESQGLLLYLEDDWGNDYLKTVYVVRPDGSGQRVLGFANNFDLASVSWLPAGHRVGISFTTGSVWVINGDGTGLQDLQIGARVDSPIWRP